MLLRGDVDVFLATPPAIDDPALLAAYDALMTDDERAKQRAYVFEKNRRESLVTRALVRTTLSRYRPVTPAAWRFVTNEHGCPRVDPPCGLAYNLSNHPSMVACAVTERAAVGVDVEPVARGGAILDLAPGVFAPSELADLAAAEDPRDRALSLWTLKEAYIKARGMGLALPLDGFALRGPDLRAPAIAFTSIDDDPARWWLRTIDVAGHRVAIAVAVEPGASAPVLRVRTCVPLREDRDEDVAITR